MRFHGEAKTEMVMCLVGIAAMSLGGILSAAPVLASSGDLINEQWKVSTLFLAIGLFLFMFATRGFRKVINADLGLAELWYGRLNGFKKTRIHHHVRMDRIEKLTTQPCRGPFEFMSLNLHLNGRTNPIRLMTGRSGEIEHLRKRLEDDVRMAIEKVNGVVEQRRLGPTFHGNGLTIGVS